MNAASRPEPSPGLPVLALTPAPAALRDQPAPDPGPMNAEAVRLLCAALLALALMWAWELRERDTVARPPGGPHTVSAYPGPAMDTHTILAALDRLPLEQRLRGFLHYGFPSWTGPDRWTVFLLPDGRESHVAPHVLAALEDGVFREPSPGRAPPWSRETALPVPEPAGRPQREPQGSPPAAPAPLPAAPLPLAPARAVAALQGAGADQVCHLPLHLEPRHRPAPRVQRASAGPDLSDLGL